MRPQRGFTLLEMLVAVFLTSLVLLALSDMIGYFYRTNGATLRQWQSVAGSRAGIERAMQEVREASAVTSASDTSFSFTVDTESAPGTYTYALDSTDLLEEGSATSTIARDVANTNDTPLFTYYDASGTQLIDPIDPAHVRAVFLQAVINASPATVATGTTLLSGATLRNATP